MPSYPLWTANLLTFVTMAILNLLFIARKNWLRVLVGIILTVYTSLVAFQRTKMLQSSLIFTDMNFDRPTQMLVCQSLSPFYEVYYMVLLSVAFVMIGFASYNIEESKYKYNQIVKMNLDRLHECMGQ